MSQGGAGGRRGADTITFNHAVDPLGATAAGQVTAVSETLLAPGKLFFEQRSIIKRRAKTEGVSYSSFLIQEATTPESCCKENGDVSL